MVKIDLHIHTNLSDGSHTITEVINNSKINNCNAISITDHEIVEDYSELAKKNSINIINGIEFNSSQKGLHILGYGIKDITKMMSYMNLLHKENEYVSYLLIKKLKSIGIDISINQVKIFLKEKNIIYNYLDKRHIVKYLIEKGITKNVYDTYKNLIGVGTDLYIPLKKISPSDIISKIDSCGGISVLAHPFTIDKNLEKLEVIIKELIDYGLVGIEVINGKNPREFQLQYELLAKKFNLIKTVGSDFHDINLSSIGIDYDEEIIDILHEKIYSKNNI